MEIKLEGEAHSKSRFINFGLYIFNHYFNSNGQLVYKRRPVIKLQDDSNTTPDQIRVIMLTSKPPANEFEKLHKIVVYYNFNNKDVTTYADITKVKNIFIDQVEIPIYEKAILKARNVEKTRERIIAMSEIINRAISNYLDQEVSLTEDMRIQMHRSETEEQEL